MVPETWESFVELPHDATWTMEQVSSELCVHGSTSPSDVGGKSYTPDWSEIGWFPRVTFFWGIKFGVNELISFKGDIYIVHLLFDHISLYPVYPL